MSIGRVVGWVDALPQWSCKNPKFCKLLQLVLAFSVTWLTLFMLLDLFEFGDFNTNWFLCTATSLVLAFSFVASTFIRCAVSVFLLEMFSCFGLTLSFFLLSWAIIEHSTDRLIDYAACVFDISNSTTTTNLPGLLMELREERDSWLLLIVLTSYLLLFIHSIWYMLSYFEKTKKGTQNYFCFWNIMYYAIAFVAGAFTTIVILLDIAQHTICNTLYDFSNCQCSADDFGSVLFWLYIGNIFITVLLLPYSGQIPKARRTVMLIYFPPDLVEPQMYGGPLTRTIPIENLSSII